MRVLMENSLELAGFVKYSLIVFSFVNSYIYNSKFCIYLSTRPLSGLHRFTGYLEDYHRIQQTKNFKVNKSRPTERGEGGAGYPRTQD